MRLSDSIESFIKAMITQQEEPEVELKRKELAEYFNCAPSQINYVLATRFTLDNGYVIESQRGGGGYIRIVRVVRSSSQKLLYLIHERIGDSISEMECARIISQLKDEQLITEGESAIIRAAVSESALAVPMPEPVKDAVRARCFKAMLTSVARQNRESGESRGQAGGPI